MSRDLIVGTKQRYTFGTFWDRINKKIPLRSTRSS